LISIEFDQINYGGNKSVISFTSFLKRAKMRLPQKNIDTNFEMHDNTNSELNEKIRIKGINPLIATGTATVKEMKSFIPFFL